MKKSAARLVDRLLDRVIAPRRESWALVLEGGAMRCIYTAGVLDSLHRYCLNRFDFVIGASAGAACGASFLANQQGRMLDIFLNYLTDKRFLDYSRVFNSNRSILDLGYAIREISTRHVPLDVNSMHDSPTKMFAVLADAQTAEPEYVQLTAENAIEALIASCNIPFLSRHAVPFQDRQYLDGGLIDPIPVRQAIEMGATRVVCVLTQPHGFRYTPRLLMKAFLNRLFGTSDKAAEMVRHEHTIYNNSKVYIELFDTPGVELLLVAPRDDFPVDLLTRTRPQLYQGYAEGYTAGTELGRRLSKFSDFAREPREQLFL